MRSARSRGVHGESAPSPATFADSAANSGTLSTRPAAVPAIASPIAWRRISRRTAASASAELAALTAGWTRDGLYPPSMRFTALAVTFEDQILGGVRPVLLLLTAAVGLLLLIVSTNVGSLILVRAESRQRELALRSALGAGRARLLGELLCEGLTLAVPAAVLGMALGALGLRLLFAIDPAIVPRADTVGLDARVVGADAVLRAPAHVGAGAAGGDRGRRRTVIAARQHDRRMALGADAAAVRRLVLARGLRLVGVGLAVGLAGALLLARAMRTLLHGVEPGDPVAVVGAAVALGVVALLASYLPARRASRVDPLTALRQV